MIRLALYIHNHQPVGNFEEVFEYAYNHSYLPLLQTLLKYKEIKFGLHNSGPLFEWLSKRHPEYLEILKELIQAGQAEILCSAFSEPILSLIPQNDAIEQIKYFKDYIYKNFEYEAKGLWLTERVWEPGLVPVLLAAGIEYTLLDDTHFRYAGLTDEDLFLYHITEHDGKILKVFPIAMKLRYLIPFHQVEETISYLKEEEKRRNNALKILGDDGEKFGVWPGTYDWVYGHNWLENFLMRLKQETWIKTVLLKEIVKEPAAGRIYLPTASYEEMGEWVLKPDAGKEYEELKRSIDPKYYHLVHGGYFKNFLIKYPEANLLHKRMIFVSQNIADNFEGKMALWRGQCSCAYWHGIFGGLYLPHLREAVYRNLIEAENYGIKLGVRVSDFDVDGQGEIIISTQNFFAVLKLDTANFIEIDDRERKVNILNFLGRRKERYHEKIALAKETDGVKSIHEIFRTKEADLARFLVYDRYERGFGIDWLLSSVPSQEDFYRQEQIGEIIRYHSYEVLDHKNVVIQFTLLENQARLNKTIQFLEGAKTIEFVYQGEAGLLGVEFSLGIFNPNLKLNNTHSLYELQTIQGIAGFTIEAENFRPIKFIASERFTLLSYPIETISSSESGLERNFQGFSLLLIFERLPSIKINL